MPQPSPRHPIASVSCIARGQRVSAILRCLPPDCLKKKSGDGVARLRDFRFFLLPQHFAFGVELNHSMTLRILNREGKYPRAHSSSLLPARTSPDRARKRCSRTSARTIGFASIWGVRRCGCQRGSGGTGSWFVAQVPVVQERTTRKSVAGTPVRIRARSESKEYFHCSRNLEPRLVHSQANETHPDSLTKDRNLGFRSYQPAEWRPPDQGFTVNRACIPPSM